MTEQENNRCGWKHCPPGAIGTLVQKQHSVDRRRILKVAGLASITVIGGAGALAYAWKPKPIELPQDLLTCRMVVDHIHVFVKGRLTEESALKMRAHFQHCPPCALNLHRQYPAHVI